MSRFESLHGERGTTLVELVVGAAVGMVVLAGLSMVIVATLHGSARVSARVDATRQGRLAVTKLMQDLHSACIAPEVAPIQEKSSETSLKFIHQTGPTVSPTPILSVVSLENGTLSQADYASTGGTAPNWTFASTPYATLRLATDIAAPSPSSGIFSYYAYTNGTISETALATPLSLANAALTIAVRVALTASPTSTPVADGGAPATVQDIATLRLTPPSFNQKVTSLPCQ